MSNYDLLLEPPLLSEQLMTQIINDPDIRARISGPNRAMIVVVFEGQNYKCHNVTDKRTHDGNDQFARDCRMIWETYTIGQVIPVICVRLNPSFTGIMLVSLPWATTSQGRTSSAKFAKRSPQGRTGLRPDN